MSKKARQMPDKNHTFVELQQIWKEGTYTLEECITQMLYSVLRFEERRIGLEFKMMPFRSDVEELDTWKSYDAIQAEAEADDLLEALKKDRSAAYKAMDFALEHYAALEMQFLKLERDVDKLIDRMDDTPSNLN